MRPITFEQAKAQYVHRYTREHIPTWARAKHNGKYYAPQYASDREWYERTLFAGESEFASKKWCYSTGQTCPYGHWLDEPFTR